MKTILLSMICIFCMPAFAQKGFYVQPTIGLGLSNANVSGTYGEGPSKNILGYNFQLAVGYKFKRLYINSGIGYMRSGRKSAYTYTTSFRPHSYDYYLGQKLEYYQQIVLPLNVGYSFALSDRLTIIPAIGLAAAYTTSVKYKNTDGRDQLYSSASDFDNPHLYKGDDMKPFNKFAAWGLVQTDLTYAIKPGIHLVAGPAVYCLLSNMVKPGAHNHYSGFPNHIQNYALFFNLGIRFALASGNRTTAETTR